MVFEVRYCWNDWVKKDVVNINLIFGNRIDFASIFV